MGLDDGGTAVDADIELDTARGTHERMDLQALGRILAGAGIALLVIGALLWLGRRR